MSQWKWKHFSTAEIKLLHKWGKIVSRTLGVHDGKENFDMRQRIYQALKYRNKEIR
jgi:hypothetical protein